jgi:Heparinase II/III-like protein
MVAITAGLLMVTPTAQAGPAACSPPYLVHSPREHSRAKVDRARDGVFKVHRRSVRLEPPVNWSRDPDDSRRYRAALSALAWLDVLFYDYLENGRRDSLDKARDLALDWIRSNPPSNGATDRTWDDRVTATRGPYLAFAMRAAACEGMLDRRRREVFRSSVLTHGARAASARRYRPTNHGLYVDTNLILLARSVPGLADGRGWVRTGKRRFKRTLGGRIVEEEGLWLEHSSAYQLAVRREVAFYGNLVGSDQLAPLVARMTDVAGWLVEPDEELWLMGSSNYGRVPPEVIGEAGDDDGLLWLAESGLAVVKRAGSYLGVASTFFNTSHKHSDDLSFELFDAGRRIVSDSGQYDKDPGRWRSFQASPQAHATLTVDGRRFPRHSRAAYGSGLMARGAGDGWDAVLARNPLLRRQGVDHRRLWLFRPGLGLIVVDRLRADRRHVYRRYFQLGTGIDAASDAGGVELSNGSWAGRLADGGPGEPARLSLAQGRRRPSILGFEFPAFRQRTPRFTVELSAAGKDRDELAVISVDPARPLQARLVSAGRDFTSVELEVSGAPAGTLEARREGDELDVVLSAARPSRSAP